MPAALGDACEGDKGALSHTHTHTHHHHTHHPSGRYLPVVACLDGVVYVEPRGYQVAKHDVIRLHHDVAAMGSQQGYICCQVFIAIQCTGMSHVCTRHHAPRRVGLHLLPGGVQTTPLFLLISASLCGTPRLIYGQVGLKVIINIL